MNWWTWVFYEENCELKPYILRQMIIIDKIVTTVKFIGKSLYFLIFNVELQILLLNLCGLSFFRFGLFKWLAEKN